MSDKMYKTGSMDLKIIIPSGEAQEQDDQDCPPGKLTTV